jgi:hypothetical protein
MLKLTALFTQTMWSVPSEFIMKRISVLLACVLSLATALPVQAHGYGYGHGGYHGGGYYHGGGGWRGGWVAPLVGAAIVGGALYAATTPSYATPVVVTPPPVVPAAPRVAYFCSTSQQYYPNVPTCAVPWQLVSY